jgi:hypothetical protein
VNQRWNADIGGWREVLAVTGGVIGVAATLSAPVFFLSAVIRGVRERRIAKRDLVRSS